MKSTEHYLNFLLSLEEKPGKGETVPITIDRLTDILHCTPRNVKLILRKLSDDGFIEWRAGRGRGNPSRMTLLKDLSEAADLYFHELLDKDKMKEAMDLLYRQNLPEPERNKLRELLDQRFGFQVERVSSATVDVLRVTIGRKPALLDPAFVSTSGEVFFLQQLCDTLVTFDPREKKYLPALAHAWESNEDGSRWTFYLRKGVRFHHGKPLTSKDVLYTLQRLRDVRSPSRWQYEQIERAEIVSDHAITFYLRQPNRLFLHFFGSYYMSILPHDVEFSERGIVGTGPFRMAEFTDQVLVMEAYEDYFKERALLDRVELWFVPEGVPNPNDRYHLPNLDDAGQDRESGEIEYLLNGCQVVYFNFRKKGIHHHPSFRKAMRLLYDRLAIAKELNDDRIVPANSFMPDKSKHAEHREASLEEAQAYLRESGYAGETLKLYYWDRKDNLEGAKWLQRRSESIGLRLSLHPIAIADFYSTDADEEADLLVICETLEDDTDWGYLRLFQDEASFLHRLLGREQHEWLKEHIREFVQLPSPEQRDEILDRIEQKFRDEDWVIFGYHMKKVSSYHPALNGVSIDSFGWIDFSKLWIKQEASVQKLDNTG